MSCEYGDQPALNRRAFTLAALSSLALLTACDTDQKPSATATLLNTSNVQESLKQLRSAISSLDSAVSGFDNGEDWKEVVPQVVSAADDVQSAFGKVQAALGVSS